MLSPLHNLIQMKNGKSSVSMENMDSFNIINTKRRSSLVITEV